MSFLENKVARLIEENYLLKRQLQDKNVRNSKPPSEWTKKDWDEAYGTTKD